MEYKIESAFHLLSDDRRVTYYPAFKEATDSVVAAILLKQIYYWWSHQGRKPFYKFSQSCKHPQYQEGDSWTEELGFTEREFRTARNKIARKVTQGADKYQLLSDCFVIYWTDSSRRTWYQVNEDKAADLLANLPIPSNRAKRQYLVSDKSADTYNTDTTTDTNSYVGAKSAPAPKKESEATRKAKARIIQALAESDTQREGISDPRKAKLQFIREIAPRLADILGREPISVDRVAAKQIWELRFDRAWLDAKLAEYRNGHGDQFRHDGATPFWIKNELERERAQKKTTETWDSIPRYEVEK